MENQKKPWTSDLSVKEWLLVKKMGFEPIGQVMGACVYHAGFQLNQMAGMSGNCELDILRTPYEQARKNALYRLSHEAEKKNADAVVGVKFVAKPNRSMGQEHVMEYNVMGTAVKIEGYQRDLQKPLLCTTTGQELIQLIEAGALPIGLVMGISMYYKYTTQREDWQEQSYYNQELQTYSRAVQQARRNGLERLRNEARILGADGVLAHQTHFHVHSVPVTRLVQTYGETEEEMREDHIIEFVSMGTAIRYDKNLIPKEPKMVMNLNKKMKKTEKNNDIKL